MILFVAFAATANAEVLNSKSVESIKVRIIYSGSLDVSGSSLKANITYYVPQEGVE